MGIEVYVERLRQSVVVKISESSSVISIQNLGFHNTKMQLKSPTNRNGLEKENCVDFHQSPEIVTTVDFEHGGL